MRQVALPSVFLCRAEAREKVKREGRRREERVLLEVTKRREARSVFRFIFDIRSDIVTRTTHRPSAVGQNSTRARSILSVVGLEVQVRIAEGSE